MLFPTQEIITKQNKKIIKKKKQNSCQEKIIFSINVLNYRDWKQACLVCTRGLLLKKVTIKI